MRERRGEVRHRIHSYLKDYEVSLAPDADQALAMLATRERLAEALKSLDVALDALAHRPLTAGQAQRLLGISSIERSRWTKDGRLPQHGTSMIKRGQLISLQTYAPSDIEHLAQHPETIRAWRECDAMGGQPLNIADS